MNVFKKKGANLNETNVFNFTRYLEFEAKQRFFQLMDHMTDALPSFINNLPEVRRKMGISCEDWPDDTMKKLYYRRKLQIAAFKLKNDLLSKTDKD